MTPSSWLLIAAFLGLNCALNIVNKWALGLYGFSFPLLLTTCHMGFSFLILSFPMMGNQYMSKHQLTLSQQWKGLLTIGVTMAANISLNNLSLVSMSLSLNQVIRSAMPICTCLLAVYIENKVPSTEEGLSLLLLSIGVMIAMWEGSMTGSLAGVALCSMATVCNAAMSCSMGRVMSEKVDTLRLAFYMAPTSCIVVAPFYMYLEHRRFVAYWPSHKVETASVVLTTSAIALLYNIVHAGLIHKTSATTVTVLGEVKIIGILLLSAWILGEKSILSPKMTIGVAMAVLGFIGYSHAQIRPQQHHLVESRPATRQDQSF